MLFIMLLSPELVRFTPTPLVPNKALRLLSVMLLLWLFPNPIAYEEFAETLTMLPVMLVKLTQFNDTPIE